MQKSSLQEMSALIEAPMMMLQGVLTDSVASWLMMFLVLLG